MTTFCFASKLSSHSDFALGWTRLCLPDPWLLLPRQVSSVPPIILKLSAIVRFRFFIPICIVLRIGDLASADSLVARLNCTLYRPGVQPISEPPTERWEGHLA